MYKLDLRKEEQKYNKTKKAYAVLFRNLIITYQFHLEFNKNAPWSNKLWDESQAKLAEFFPLETAQFCFIILENSTFQKNLSPAAYASVLSNLTELAQKLETQGK